MENLSNTLKKKNLCLAIILSIVPGLSLLYVGKVRKALPIFVIDAGIVIGFLTTGSYLIRLLLINVYLVTFSIPLIEAYQLVRYGKNTLNTEARWYVVTMLLTTGFNALPLLWQAGSFTKRSKIAWTATVPLLFVVFVMFLMRYFEELEELLRRVIS